VLRPQFLREQRVVEQVYLPDRQVVGSAPTGIDEVKLGRRQRSASVVVMRIPSVAERILTYAASVT